MATSGTIGQTTFKTSAMLEKAIRRIGLLPAVLTPEIVNNALETLYMLLMSMSNRGLNLWCIDKQLVTLSPNQATYVLPEGTQDILNVLQSTPTLVTGTNTVTATDYQVDLGESTPLVRFGVRFSTRPTASFSLQHSADGVTWTTAEAFTDIPANNELKWYDVDPSLNAQYYRLHSASHVVDTLYLSTVNREVPLAAFNRDDYANQPAKNQLSQTPTNYYFEKLIDPQITFWPVPNDETRCIVLYRYRQIQDVGSLTQEVELPARWYEAVTWQWAERLAYEIPGVDPARRQEVINMAERMTLEVERGEGDGSPLYIQPQIRYYTR